MPALATVPPPRRPELVLSPLGGGGQYVVKDPRTGAYYNLGEPEFFLLSRLDGAQTAVAICQAFAEHFGEPLSEEDFGDFLRLAEGQGFLGPPAGDAPPPGGAPGPRGLPCGAPAAAPAPVPRPRQSLLYWRKSLFDPDRLFTWLAPKVRFLWTGGFLVSSLGCILAAGALAWASRQELVSHFAGALRWETAVLVWLTLLAATTLHEFAHGLTCKHYGGEVHEVGFLLMYFVPCFYCNVSDAWLLPARGKRLAVTLAVGYCDLCLWALAVFAWRLTPPAGLGNYLAWVVLSVVGARVFFNFNPLMKLDGYYLLSDGAGVPNLQRRAADRVKGHLRRLLWGAPRPAPEPRGTFLTWYGSAHLLFALVFLGLMLAGLLRFLGDRWGPLGLVVVTPLATATLRGVFGGVAGGEVRKMFLLRRKWTLAWGLLLGAAGAGLYLGRMEDRAGGPFQVRPAVRAEVRAPVAGFIRQVYGDEGDRVATGTVLLHLEVPDLASRRARKDAEVREARAKLRLLEEGPRREELWEQRRRVGRAGAWRDLGRADLGRARQELRAELARLDAQSAQYDAQLRFAQASLARARKLRAEHSASAEEYEEAEKKCDVFRLQAEQARAQKRTREALGTREAEAELARREKELADAEGALALLEAGTRPGEVEAQRAHLARLEEEARYLDSVQEKVQVYSPVSGLIATPRLREKVGRYVTEGDLLCQVEDPDVVEAEVAVPEQEVARVRPGQPVGLKARGLPFEVLAARVDRIAPSSAPPEAPALGPAPARGEVPGTVTVYCRLEGPGAGLRPGMTGYGRVYCGQRRVGEVLADRALAFLRTEFWW